MDRGSSQRARCKRGQAGAWSVSGLILAPAPRRGVYIPGYHPGGCGGFRIENFMGAGALTKQFP